MKNPILIALGVIAATLLFMIVAVIAPTSTEKINAAKATDALHLVRTQLPIPKPGEISGLIASGDYREFERLSNEYQSRFETDPLYESPLVKLYDAFDGKSPGIEKYLKTWVETEPSYMSYSAIGAYYTHRGYYVRGEEYVSETPEENIRDMKKLHKKAKYYLRKAIKVNDRFSPPYTLLMYAEKSSGNRRQIKKIHDRGLKQIPESFYIRLNYIGALLPRWGGSYSAMSDYLNAINYEEISNPRVWVLQGSVEGEKGYTALLRADYSASIDHYNAALEFGDQAYFLRKRGEAYWNIGELDDALDDLSRALVYMADNKKIQKWVRYLEQELDK